MLGVLRRERLLDEVLRTGSAMVSSLSDSLRVSEATIRRDLEALEREGLLRRTHGGAVPVEACVAEPSVQERASLHIAEKRRIGAAAADLIEGGDTIAMTGGTTTMQVARCIRQQANLTVVTNAINVVMELAKRSNITVVTTGGRLRPRTLELVGPLTEQTLQDIFVDKAFIGVNGLTVAEGLTTHDETEAVISRIMIRAARRVIVVADHSKLNHVAFARMGGIGQVHTLITDSAADPEILAELRRIGTDVRVV